MHGTARAWRPASFRAASAVLPRISFPCTEYRRSQEAACAASGFPYLPEAADLVPALVQFPVHPERDHVSSAPLAERALAGEDHRVFAFLMREKHSASVLHCHSFLGPRRNETLLKLLCLQNVHLCGRRVIDSSHYLNCSTYPEIGQPYRNLFLAQGFSSGRKDVYPQPEAVLHPQPVTAVRAAHDLPGKEEHGRAAYSAAKTGGSHTLPSA
jgi:hypothetical protein